MTKIILKCHYQYQIYTFNTCLKSIIYCNENKNENDMTNIWRLVEFILNKMSEYNVNKA